MMFKTSKKQVVEIITPLEWEFREYEVKSWKELDAKKQLITKTRENLINCVHIKFEKTSEHEIIRKRFKVKPGIIFKKGGELFVAEMPKGFRLSLIRNLLSEHKCRDCEHLSAKPDCYGGCAKVRDRTFRYMYGEETIKHRKVELLRDIQMSQRIEKYAFIEKGVETFNVPILETFVLECAHFERIVEK